MNRPDYSGRNGRERQPGVDRRQLRIRELAMPADVRINDPRLRDLRDAYLGMMQLDDAARNKAIPPQMHATEYLELLRQRGNARAQMAEMAKELEYGHTREQLAQTKEAAKRLFELQRQQSLWRRK